MNIKSFYLEFDCRSVVMSILQKSIARYTYKKINYVTAQEKQYLGIKFNVNVHFDPLKLTYLCEKISYYNIYLKTPFLILARDKDTNSFIECACNFYTINHVRGKFHNCKQKYRYMLV